MRYSSVKKQVIIFSKSLPGDVIKCTHTRRKTCESSGVCVIVIVPVHSVPSTKILWILEGNQDSSQPSSPTLLPLSVTFSDLRYFPFIDVNIKYFRFIKIKV